MHLSKRSKQILKAIMSSLNIVLQAKYKKRLRNSNELSRRRLFLSLMPKGPGCKNL